MPFAKHCKWVPPSSLPVLKNRQFSKADIKQLSQAFDEAESTLQELSVDPLNWLDCFEERVRKEILDRLSAVERLENRKRNESRRLIPDPELLQHQNPHMYYKPKKFGIRVFCLSTDREIRAEFISRYRAFCQACSKTWHSWIAGDFSATLPPDAFCPPRWPLWHSLAFARGS
jgi:hypothetical protein